MSGDTVNQCSQVPVWEFKDWLHPGGSFVTIAESGTGARSPPPAFNRRALSPTSPVQFRTPVIEQDVAASTNTSVAQKVDVVESVPGSAKI